MTENYLFSKKEKLEEHPQKKPRAKEKLEEHPKKKSSEKVSDTSFFDSLNVEETLSSMIKEKNLLKIKLYKKLLEQDDLSSQDIILILKSLE